LPGWRCADPRYSVGSEGLLENRTKHREVLFEMGIPFYLFLRGRESRRFLCSYVPVLRRDTGPGRVRPPQDLLRQPIPAWSHAHCSPHCFAPRLLSLEPWHLRCLSNVNCHQPRPTCSVTDISSVSQECWFSFVTLTPKPDRRHHQEPSTCL
jgi:hypothetical protein